MLPIILLSVLGIVVLFLGFSGSRSAVVAGTILSLILAFVANLAQNSGFSLGDTFATSMLVTDPVSTAFGSIILLSALLVVPVSGIYLDKKHSQPAEYFAILLFSLVGALMMVGYENLIMLFLGVEILSISMYVLAGSDKRNLLGNEAALKYFLMGSFATGIFLFGVALLYGATGSFAVTDIALYIDSNASNLSPLLYMGLLLVVIGLLFKVSAAPFHFWTPDVYEGSPSVFTAFMSTVVKTAGFAALYKLLSLSFGDIHSFWALTLLTVTALTLVVGNVIAAQQDSFKRMLAYSGISHAGYLLIAVTSLTGKSLQAILFYSLAYSIATIAAFGVLILVSDRKNNSDFEGFNGLAHRNPLLAFVMTVSMCSLAGIPLTGGFFGKFFISARLLRPTWFGLWYWQSLCPLWVYITTLGL